MPEIKRTHTPLHVTRHEGHAEEIPGWLAATHITGSFLVLRELSGMVLDDRSDKAVGQMVAGVLLEGAEFPRSRPDLPDDDVELTFWAGGVMHKMRTYQLTEVVVFEVMPADA